MKALLFTHLYPSPAHPGRAVFNAQLFRALSRYCETRIVVPEPWWAHRAAKGAPVANAPANVDYPGYWAVPGMQKMRAGALYRGVRSYVARLFDEFPFDVILAAWAYPDAVAAAALARDFDRPLVINVLGSDINALARRPELAGQILGAMRLSSTVVAVSYALAERVAALGVGPEKIAIHHNGVDGDRFFIRDRDAARKIAGIRRNARALLYLGRLSPEKGVDVLLQAMPALDGIELIIAGDGPQSAMLRDLSRKLCVDNRVRFVGGIPHQEIPVWISAANALVLPSRREGCPNVVLEALASGVPVVASRVGGLPELIDAHNGILVPPDDPGALADAIGLAVTRPWDRHALRKSTPYLSWDEVALKYVGVMQAAVMGKIGPNARRLEIVA